MSVRTFNSEFLALMEMTFQECHRILCCDCIEVNIINNKNAFLITYFLHLKVSKILIYFTINFQAILFISSQMVLKHDELVKLTRDFTVQDLK